MAPFNFKKKLTNKDKKSPTSDSRSPSGISTPATSTPSKEVAGSPFQTYLQKQQHQQQNEQASQSHYNQAPVSNPELQRQRQQQRTNEYQNHHPEQQHQSSRVYPTPPPAQQRNVSGASTNLPQNRREYTPWNRIKLQNSPFPRYRHVASTYISDDNRVYVIGGLHDESVYGDTWIITANENNTMFTTKTVDIGDSTPPPRVGHAATLCGNAFVLFGGDTHKVNSEGLMDDDIYLFNINSYKWTIPHPIGPRPLGRYGHKISIIATNQMKTKLYLFGGQFDDTYFNDLAVYDLSSFRRPDSHWEFLKSKTFVPPPLTNHTMVSHDNKLWVFGGDTLQGLINQVFMYDTVINDWSLVETSGAKPPPLQEHAALIYESLMCVVGGKDDQDVYMNSIYFLNLKSLKWFKFPVFKAGIPQGRSGHSITLLKNNKILIMGGDKFDYARQGEYDLSTSETDMGRGTILYTLDLSRLEEFCPGIFDVSESVVTPFNPTTPPINNSAVQTTKPNQPEPILTPYTNEPMQTPTITRILPANMETPQSKVVELSENAEKADAGFNDLKADQNYETRQVEIKKPVSPVPALVQDTVDNVTDAPRVVSLSSENNDAGRDNDTEEEVGIATVVSSPTKGDIKYDNLESLSKEKVQHVLKGPVEILESTESDDTTLRLKKINDVAFSKEHADFDVVENLRSELQALKLETEKTAADATEYINGLEEEVGRLTMGLPSDPHDADFIRMESRYRNMAYNSSTLSTRVSELELLLNVKFLDAKRLNEIIKEQNSMIEKLEEEPLLRIEMEDLRRKLELCTKENVSLKEIMKEFNVNFKNDISRSTKQLDTLVSRWAADSKAHLKDNDENSTDGQGTAQFYFGNNTSHQNAVKAMQDTLEKVLGDYKSLQESNKKTNLEYEELKANHDLLTKDFQQKKEELESNYAETINSSTNTSRALEISQLELEKYQKANKKLQEELEELKYTHDSSNGDIVADSANGNISTSSTNLAGSQGDLNIKFNRYNMKINDLKAELYIMRQERDNLKKEVIELKKKQFLDDE